MAASETIICNIALARIGAKRINDLAEDTSINAIHCRTHYEETRDALLRSHTWRFARARKVLSQDATDPAFEWDNQFDLPNDFLRMRAIYSDNNSPNRESYYSYALEGKKLLTNEGAIEIRYVKRVTDTSEFDPLFTEVLSLQLALKLCMAIGQDQTLHRTLLEELLPLIAAVRTVDKQETNTIGRDRKPTWNDSRLMGRRADLG